MCCSRSTEAVKLFLRGELFISMEKGIKGRKSNFAIHTDSPESDSCTDKSPCQRIALGHSHPRVDPRNGLGTCYAAVQRGSGLSRA